MNKKKVQNFIIEHQQALLVGAGFIAAIVGTAILAYNIGQEQAWLPPLHVETFEKDGRIFMSINNHLFEKEIVK